MDLSPRLLGVSAAVLVGGILGGAALGTVPPMQQRGMTDWLPEARTLAFDHRPQGDLPDHYPLVTRAGTVEVHELGERGLYSQARYAYRAAYDAYYPEDEWHDGYGDPAAATEPAAASAAAPAAASWEREADEATQPLAPVGPEVAEVTPRIVDVAAELAARRGAEGAVAYR